MNSVKRYRVVVIDPSPVIRCGVASLLESEGPEFNVVGTWATPEAFRGSAIEADMVLMNPAVVSSFRRFNVREMFADLADAVLVALVGGYVDRDTLESFDGAVVIYDGGEAMAQKLKKIALESNDAADRRGSGIDSPLLSDREKEILVAVARGLTNKVIADRHNISIHTVISHRKNIMRKTGIKTVSGLTMYAVFNNLISHDEG